MLCPAQLFGNNHRIRQGRASSESSHAVAHASLETYRSKVVAAYFISAGVAVAGPSPTISSTASESFAPS